MAGVFPVDFNFELLTFARLPERLMPWYFQAESLWTLGPKTIGSRRQVRVPEKVCFLKKNRTPPESTGRI